MSEIRAKTAALRGYFHTYDPANFSLIYTLKAGCALAAVLAAGVWLISPQQLVFAIFASVFVFYMHTFDESAKKPYYIGIFGILAALVALVVPALSQMGPALAVVVFFWVFAANLTAGISADIHKVSTYLTILAMAMLIPASLGRFEAGATAFAVLLGTFISLLFRTISFYSYGAYTRRQFGVILRDLRYMSAYLAAPEFEHWHATLQGRLNALNTVLCSPSASIKDPSLIRHQELVAFYLQKCEEIALCLLSLRGFYAAAGGAGAPGGASASGAAASSAAGAALPVASTTPLATPDAGLLRAISSEIERNFTQLEGIFYDRPAVLDSAALVRLKSSGAAPDFADALALLHYKMQLIASGGSAKIAVKQPKRTSQLGLRELLRAGNKYFRYALKTALACAFALALAAFLQLDHGIWIAMGTFTLFKQKINATKINNTDTLIGSLIGVAAGLGLIFLLGGEDSGLLIFLLLFISYLLAIYFRHFPQRLAMVFIMMNTAIFFCAVGLDYEQLLAFRLIDFLAAYAIVLAFSALWPAKSEDELKPQLQGICTLWAEYFEGFSPVVRSELSRAISDYAALSAEISDEKIKITHKCMLNNIFSIQSATIALCEHLKTRQIGINERNDIDIIKTRFLMLAKTASNLPAFFYDELEGKLLSPDAKIRSNCHQIFNFQSRIFEFLR